MQGDRLVLHEGQVVAHLGDAVLVGDRPVPGHDRLDVHAQHQVARRDPVGQRAGPHDGRATDEQDVAGEHDGRVGDVRDGVAPRVRGADLDQLHVTTPDLDVEPALEGAGGQAQLDAVELERAEERPEQLADVARARR